MRIGKPDATDDGIETAARAANIHEFIVGLPDGYNTVVGERDAKLSGGQRQRLAFTRLSEECADPCAGRGHQ